MRTWTREGFISGRHRDSPGSCVKKEDAVLTHLWKYLLYPDYLQGTVSGPRE